jgi:hypothetical protein
LQAEEAVNPGRLKQTRLRQDPSTHGTARTADFSVGAMDAEKRDSQLPSPAD